MSNKGFRLYFEDFEGRSLDRAAKLLAGIPGGLSKALASALKRTATSTEAFAARAVRSEYVVTSSAFKEYTTSKRHISTSGGSTEVSISFNGYHIPIIRFDTSVGKSGRITTRVMRGSSRKVLENAFSARLGNDFGIYERVGAKRFPVRQLWGPATTQMMYSNEDVLDAINEHSTETFDKRLDHEVTRILNGFGR